ncbi:hypothetical protein [Nocardiopsis synnemataformans]|uniref:hypothetical protein n=1 Tax=Nocardiopsis synnemataformans TaxID=61305 RepID=UPI003EB8FF07
MSQTTAPPIPAKDSASASTTRAAIVLASLTATHPELPGLHWSVTPYLSLGGNAPANDINTRVGQVAAWSRALDVPVLVAVPHAGDLGTASVSTTLSGVRVDVWAVVYRDEDETPVELSARIRSLVIAAGGEV